VGKQFTSQTTSQLFNPHVTNALDQNKIFDRVALRLMVQIASALGCDPSTMPLSCSTIRRARKKQGKNMLKQSGLNLQQIIHWFYTGMGRYCQRFLEQEMLTACLY